ncbi:hypothetical protein QVD17_08340 [Tagetes erecta]|uniref:Uncharacterized protein n=1 Tax=Tagetes erecta TaxID=13708 RepID=A0AAD8L4E5_TARER|nr:hypothetical protein QVD17_08340 [Tagetes erecta]
MKNQILLLFQEMIQFMQIIKSNKIEVTTNLETRMMEFRTKTHLRFNISGNIPATVLTLHHQPSPSPPPQRVLTQTFRYLIHGENGEINDRTRDAATPLLFRRRTPPCDLFVMMNVGLAFDNVIQVNGVGDIGGLSLQLTIEEFESMIVISELDTSNGTEGVTHFGARNDAVDDAEFDSLIT